MSNQYQYIINSLKKKDYKFEELALEIFSYQCTHNPSYQNFLSIIGCDTRSIVQIDQIPFLPISLFKSKLIQTADWKHGAIFLSSGTGGQRSRHLIRDLSLYRENAQSIFEEIYGPLTEYCILALLPKYHQNPNSSLLTMVDHFMSVSGHADNKYYLSSYEELSVQLKRNRINAQKTILFGVSFALLDYLDRHHHEGLINTTVIETGGMKRFRREIVREEMHNRLRKGFGGAKIHSEYGMTECQSQIYQTSAEGFRVNQKMCILIGDPTDPGHILKPGRVGQIQIVDLSNVDTASFIRTDDLGRIDHDGNIQILGRSDHRDLRGCNYLI